MVLRVHGAVGSDRARAEYTGSDRATVGRLLLVRKVEAAATSAPAQPLRSRFYQAPAVKYATGGAGSRM